MNIILCLRLRHPSILYRQLVLINVDLNGPRQRHPFYQLLLQLKVYINGYSLLTPRCLHDCISSFSVSWCVLYAFLIYVSTSVYINYWMLFQYVSYTSYVYFLFLLTRLCVRFVNTPISLDMMMSPSESHRLLYFPAILDSDFQNRNYIGNKCD